MSDADFPALGFDPAVGDVTKVRTIGSDLTDTARYAREAHDTLKDIENKRDVWTGDAADQFADTLDDLPGYLNDADESLSKAGKALSTWSDQLETHQNRARDLEKQAKQALSEAEDADENARQAVATANTPISYPQDDPAAAQEANRQAQDNADKAASTESDARAKWDRVEEIRKQAEDVKERWEDDARVCQEQLDEAGEKAPSSGLLDKIGDAISSAAEWLGDHLGDIAGVVSAVAGVLALIPVCAPIAGPIAIGAGAVALGTHGTKMVVEGKWDEPGAWGELAGDALGLIPGAGAISKGFNAATDAAAGAGKLVDVGSSTGRMASMADTAGEVLGKGGKAFADEATNLTGEASKLYQRLGQSTMGAFTEEAGDFAKAAQASVDTALQVPAGISLAGGGQEAQDAADATGWAAAGQNAVKADNVQRWIGSIAKSL